VTIGFLRNLGLSVDSRRQVPHGARDIRRVLDDAGEIGD
jgi:hypothetical protein